MCLRSNIYKFIAKKNVDLQARQGYNEFVIDKQQLLKRDCETRYISKGGCTND